MKKTLLTVVITLVVILLVSVLFIYSGIYNVSQTAEHNPGVLWAINTTKERSIHSRTEEIKEPQLTAPSMMETGFIHYNSMCVMCHGKPGSDLSEIAKGLTPKPPDLFKHASEEDASEMYWVIKNGIKFTAMPAFGPTHSDEDIWNIVAFIKKNAGMSAAEYAEWQKKNTGSTTPGDSSTNHYSDGHAH